MEIDFFEEMFSGEKALDEHSIAWMSKDWEKEQKLADSYKEPAEKTLFKIIENITFSKKPEMVNVDGDYSKFMIDNALSQYVDCLSYVNVMNLFGAGLTEQMHHDYYLMSISKEKRFSKWATYKEEVETLFIIKIIMKRSSVSYETARMYMNILKEKGTLNSFLLKNKFIITDEFYKSVTKNSKEKKLLVSIVEEWK